MKISSTIKFMLPLLWIMFFFGMVNAHVEQPKDFSGIGLDQKLGQTIPLDLTFQDENGHSVMLRELVHRPTVLAFVYLHCPNICSLLLQNLADVVNRLPAEPGKDYAILTISFDERETPSLSLQKKAFYLKMIHRAFPPDTWRFLTGDKANIDRSTEAVGFHFKRVGDDFEHPVVLIILAPDGKITRYLYGADPLPFDLQLGLVEASHGKIGPAISKIARFCFSYDPKGKKFVFNMLRVTGTVTLLFALSFILFLIFKGKKPKTGEEP